MQAKSSYRNSNGIAVSLLSKMNAMYCSLLSRTRRIWLKRRKELAKYVLGIGSRERRISRHLIDRIPFYTSSGKNTSAGIDTKSGRI